MSIIAEARGVGQPQLGRCRAGGPRSPAGLQRGSVWIGPTKGLANATNSAVTSDPEGAIQASGTSLSAFATSDSGARKVPQEYGSDELRLNATITPSLPASAASTAALPQR